jgi:hypothetical protein
MQKNEKENCNKILLNSKVCSTVQALPWDVGLKTFYITIIEARL